jgi:alkanesulfonate monooxygenase SsuD/methylene tetrahydromethanopterin reductase-like flavin-dependent oxidoreductase (luciferase family)
MLGLAALSRHTRLPLGLGVLLLPTWPALRLAYETAILDQLCRGRLIVGVGSGREPTWREYGVDPSTVRRLIDETLRALRALWRGDRRYHGELVRVDVGLATLPAREGGPPIWVGGYNAYAARRAATLGDAWYGGSGQTFDDVRRQVIRYRRELGRAGKDPASARTALNRIAIVRNTDADAEALAAAHLGAGGSRYAADRTNALIGSPDTVLGLIRRYRDVGVTDVQLRVATGSVPRDVARETVRLVAEEVLPRL